LLAEIGDRDGRRGVTNKTLMVKRRQRTAQRLTQHKRIKHQRTSLSVAVAQVPTDIASLNAVHLTSGEHHESCVRTEEGHEAESRRRATTHCQICLSAPR
jgi:hypothetical protein